VRKKRKEEKTASQSKRGGRGTLPETWKNCKTHNERRADRTKTEGEKKRGREIREEKVGGES